METSRTKKGYFLVNSKKHITRSGLNLIGRNKEATVIIKDTSISHHHALLVILDNGKHYLSDFNSSNGTFLNSTKLQPLRLYEIQEGASVQFAEIKSTYFKVTGDNTEVNTQQSDSSQITDNTFFNAKTQIVDISFTSPKHLANKTNQARHISDHIYTKLLDDNEDILSIASTSDSLCVNHTNEVGAKAHNETEGARESVVAVVQQQLADIHDLPTPIKTSSRESIHDLPTQIIDRCKNDEMQSSSLSIHELPTQLIVLPGIFGIGDVKNMEDSTEKDLQKEKVTEPSTSMATDEVPTQIIHKSNVCNNAVGENVLQESIKESTSNELEQTHNEPPHLVNEIETSQAKTDKVIDETLPETSQLEQNSADMNDNSTDSFDFMPDVTQHFADVCLDFETQSKELSKKVRNIIKSDDETDSDSEFKVIRSRQTKKNNIIDSSQETDVDFDEDLAKDGARNNIKSGPDLEADVEKRNAGVKFTKVDSDSETDAEIDFSRLKEKAKIDSANKIDKVNDSELIETRRAKKTIIDSSDETDVEDEINKDKEKQASNDENVNTRMKFMEADSDSETDVEGDFSREKAVRHGKDRSPAHHVDNEKAIDKIPETKIDSGNKINDDKLNDSDSDSELIKTKRTKITIIESSDETDIEDEINKDKEKQGLNDYKKVNTETKIVNSDSGTDVEGDLREQKVKDGDEKSPTHHVNNDEKANEEDLFKTTKIDEEKIDDDKPDKINKTADNIDANSTLDDTDIIPVTQNSFVGEIDFDFDTKDLDYAATKFERGKRQVSQKKSMENTSNMEEPLGDSFNLALSSSMIEPSEHNHFEDETQKTMENGVSNDESESIFLKPTQKLDEKNDADDDIFIQSTQQLSENQSSSGGASEEIFLQPQIIVTEQRLSLKSNDDSVFIKPTQKIQMGGSVEEKMENIFRPTQADDDSIFLEATQKLPEKEKDADNTLFKLPQVGSAQNTESQIQAEDNIFMQATQITPEERDEKSSVNRKLIPHDDIFMQATQVVPEVRNSNKEMNKIEEKPNTIGKLTSDDDIFMQATQVAPEVQNSIDKDVLQERIQVTSIDSKGNLVKNVAYSVESQLEVMFASQNVKLIEDENFRPENPLGNMFTSLQSPPEITQEKEKTSKENEMNVEASSTRKTRMKSTDSNDDVQLDKPRRGGAKKSYNLGTAESDAETTRRNVRLTRTALKTVEDVPKISTDEDKIDLLFKTTRIMENDFFPEPAEPVSRRTRQSPQPTESGNVNLKSVGKKAVKSQLVTVKERPELLSKVEVILTSSKGVVSAGHQSEEEVKLQSKKRNVKITKYADNFGEGSSNDDVKSERSRRYKAKSDLKQLEEDSNVINNNIIKMDETPHRTTKRTRNKIEVAHTSDSSNDFELTLGSELPRKKSTKESSTTKLKDGEENVTLSGKLKIKTKNLKLETDEKTDVSELPTTSKKIANEIIACKEDIKLKDSAENISTKRNTRNKNYKLENLRLETDEKTDASELPVTSKKIAKEAITSKEDIKLKGSAENINTKRNTRSKHFKLENDQKTDVKEKKQRSKRTNSINNDETEEISVKNGKKKKRDSVENENSIDFIGLPENETPSTSTRATSRKTQKAVLSEKAKSEADATTRIENEISRVNMPGSETPSTNKRTKSRQVTSVKVTSEMDATSDDEFVPSVSKKKRKNLVDDDNKDVATPGTPTRKKLLHLQNSALNTPERLKRKLKPKVVFTMMDSPELESLIRSLGGSIVDTVEACTVLVTGNVKRSQKLLAAVGLGKPICSPKWLQECKKSGYFIDPWDHVLVDDEAEEKWNFSLKQSLQRSVEKKLLENYIVHLIVNSAQDVLKGAIEACGGKCVTRAPPKNTQANYIIVSTQDNRSKYAKFLKQTPQPVVVASEAIFDGVLRQELHFEEHLLT